MLTVIQPLESWFTPMGWALHSTITRWMQHIVGRSPERVLFQLNSNRLWSNHSQCQSSILKIHTRATAHHITLYSWAVGHGQYNHVFCWSLYIMTMHVWQYTRRNGKMKSFKLNFTKEVILATSCWVVVIQFLCLKTMHNYIWTYTHWYHNTDWVSLGIDIVLQIAY